MPLPVLMNISRGHYSPLFLCVTFRSPRSYQIPQAPRSEERFQDFGHPYSGGLEKPIRRIIAANTILIGIHLQHILRPIGIVLQRRLTL